MRIFPKDSCESRTWNKQFYEGHYKWQLQILSFTNSYPFGYYERQLRHEPTAYLLFEPAKWDFFLLLVTSSLAWGSNYLINDNTREQFRMKLNFMRS